MQLSSLLKVEPFNMKANDIKARIKQGSMSLNGVAVKTDVELDIEGVIVNFPDWFCKNFTAQQMFSLKVLYDNVETLFNKDEEFCEYSMDALPILRDVQFNLHALKTSKSTYWVLK